MKNRLIELLKTVPPLKVISFGGRAPGRHYQTLQNIADHLIANGVVIIDPVKYPPVTNRGIIDSVMGMPIDEMAELIKAKQEGRIIVPPVELGSRHKIYIPINGTTVVYETKVYAIGVDEDGDMTINPKEYPEEVIAISGYNIGKTVFLTKEEAEKALAERIK